MASPAENFQRATTALQAQQWSEAATRLRAGLATKPDAAPWRYVQLGRALFKTGDHGESAAAYREAVHRRSDAPAQWYFELGRSEVRLQHWEAAASALETACERRTTPPPRVWRVLRGLSYERLRRWEAAREVYRAWLDDDPRTTEVERQMLAVEVEEFPGRLRIERFIAKRLDEIREQAEQPLPARSDAADPDLSDSIYVYWAQGFDAAPELVRLCHQRLLERSSAPVIELDEERLAEFVEVPADVDAIGIGHTHRSDLLRLELLARYGGTWIDATCLLVADPADEVPRLRAGSGYFAFAKRRTTLATWFMSSTPDHRIVRMLLAALYTYWRTFGRLTHYFALHHIFEALTVLDEAFARAWRDSPRLPYSDPFRIRWSLLDRYQPERFQTMINSSFVHKLTYKFDAERATPDTMIGHLLQTKMSAEAAPEARSQQ